MSKHHNTMDLNSRQTHQQQTPSQSRVHPHQNDQSIQIPNAQCVYHPNLNVTNICLESQCILPLCPECIPTHLALHKQNGSFPSFQRIETVQMDAVKTVGTISQEMRGVFNTIQELNRIYESDTVVRMKQELANSKQRMMQVVESYFDDLEKEFNDLLYKQGQKNKDELETAQRFIATKNNDLQTLESKLQSEKFLKYLVRLYTTNYIQECLTFNQDCQNYIDAYKSNELIDLKTNESKYTAVQEALSKFMSIENSEKLRQQQQPKDLQLMNKNFQQIISPNKEPHPHPILQSDFDANNTQHHHNNSKQKVNQQLDTEQQQQQQQAPPPHLPNDQYQTPQPSNNPSKFSYYPPERQNPHHAENGNPPFQSLLEQAQQKNNQVPPPPQPSYGPGPVSHLQDPYHVNPEQMLQSKRSHFPSPPQPSHGPRPMMSPHGYSKAPYPSFSHGGPPPPPGPGYEYRQPTAGPPPGPPGPYGGYPSSPYRR